ncbi:MAG: hypothetical protein J5548_04880 [Prevotella sp.]|nr:hypothetical protein [Prevotella sp.]
MYILLLEEFPITVKVTELVEPVHVEVAESYVPSLNTPLSAVMLLAKVKTIEVIVFAELNEIVLPVVFPDAA